MTERDFLNEGFRATQPMENRPIARPPPTERDFLNEGFRASQPSGPRIEVVMARFASRQRQLVAAGSVRESIVALAPVEIPAPFVAPPSNLVPDTIVPLELRAPTASLVSTDMNTGRGMPWTTGPASMAIAAAPLGALIVQVGRAVIAQIAIAGLEDLLGRAKKKYNRRDVLFRYRSGSSGELGTGNIVRPRGPGGEIPEGTDPYEDPDDFSMWRPWTWF